MPILVASWQTPVGPVAYGSGNRENRDDRPDGTSARPGDVPEGDGLREE